MYEVESRDSRTFNLKLQGNFLGPLEQFKPEKLVPGRSGVLAGSPRRHALAENRLLTSDRHDRLLR
ncbi:hypothetical protein K466DRAFT_582550 [Polyporus arcularius HHB13444]|uniref:Uncharacterized protein n=1 Tax=Polyporus arcularius HHB13444 TaxID=1314778 RepID=A0A5C3PQ70_9APHY|nr:hypothetical protein K466DRAFT_582550 [Polyporus arcularius HHB13444]